MEAVWLTIPLIILALVLSGVFDYVWISYIFQIFDKGDKNEKSD